VKPAAKGFSAWAVVFLAGAAFSPPTAGPAGCPSGPEAVSVRSFGARGDGQTDDTAAIQAAVDALPRRGRLQFPPGTYRIATDRGVRLKDDIRLELGDAVLLGPNVTGARCRILEIQGRRNVVISGGTLIGSRSGSPEWGVGILASDAVDLVIEGVTLRDFYFDGILLTGNQGCRRVLVRGCLAENNRRTGLAAPAVEDLTVVDSTFRGTRGQSPQAGANCEPNRGGEVRRVRFKGCTFAGNAGVGLYIHRGLGVVVSDATAEDNRVEGNDQGIVAAGVDGVSIVGNHVLGHRGRARSAIALGEGTGRATVAGNRLEDNFRGIVAAGAVGVDIRENIVVGTGPLSGPGAGQDGDGIVCRGLRSLLAEACTVSGNRVHHSAGSGIAIHLVSRVRLADNLVDGSGQSGILLRSTTDSEVTGNVVSGSGFEVHRRYDAIEVVQSSNDNLIAQNVCRLAPATRDGVGIGPGCRGNRVFGNVVIPWPGEGAAPQESTGQEGRLARWSR
jgi:parallel beta-helix repeat protein